MTDLLYHHIVKKLGETDLEAPRRIDARVIFKKEERTFPTPLASFSARSDDCISNT